MDNLKYVTVKEKNDIDTVVLLAEAIWNEHYRDIIGQKQIDYMLDKFQSYVAIKKAIQGGEKYFIIEYQGMPIGYFAFLLKGKKIYLDKIYILKERRNEKIGEKCIDYIVEYAKSQNIKCVYLTVNKHNTNSIKAYQSYGFKTEVSVVTDIGGGFVMDDFRMYLYL